MRTHDEAQALIKELVPLVTGLPIHEIFTVGLSDDDFGTPLGAIVREDDGHINILGLDISPRRYWQELSRSGLFAIIAQEWAHGTCTELPALMVELTEKVLQVKTDLDSEGSAAIALRQNQIREEYELAKGLIIGITNWKLHCDLIAINRLCEQSLPVDGQIEWLDYELEEEGRQPLLHSRRLARQWLVRMRILHSKLLISNTEKSLADATTIRTYIKNLSDRILTS